MLIITPLILKGETSDVITNIIGPSENAKNIMYKIVETNAKYFE